MPKMKTSKTAKKRFRKTGKGKLRRQQAMRQHLFENKPSTRTRRLDGTVDVHPGDARRSGVCSPSVKPSHIHPPTPKEHPPWHE